MQAKKHLKNGVKIKILIADREGVFRLGLKKLFSVEDDLRVVAQAENPLQVLAMTKSFKPDLAVVQKEIALEGLPNFVPSIREQSPECKVIVTESHLTDEEQKDLLREGVLGIIARSAMPETFIENVRAVSRGEAVLPSEQMTPQEEHPLGSNKHSPRPVDTLTRRERTVISCLTHGWHNREIAQHLTITEQTVKNHLRSIYDKVGVSDRLELVLYAIHQRMELPPVDSFI